MWCSLCPTARKAKPMNAKMMANFEQWVNISQSLGIIIHVVYTGFPHQKSGKKLMDLTSSSAVAKRPRDASCLSIVSFNSTKRRTESFIVSYVRYRFILHAIKCCSVVFGVTLKLLIINISPSFPAINKHRRLLPAKCHNLWVGGPTASYWQHLAGSSVNSTHWSQILAQNRDFCLPHLHSTPPLGGFTTEYCYTVWYEKLEWCGYHVVKFFWRYVIRFDRMYERDRHTDRQGDRWTD